MHNATDNVDYDAKELDDTQAEEETPDVVPSIKNIDSEEVITKLTFNDMDSELEDDNKVNEVEATKTIERLEDISTTRAIQRKLDEEDSDDEERIQISTEPVDLSGFDVLDGPASRITTDDILLNDIDELPPI